MLRICGLSCCYSREQTLTRPIVACCRTFAELMAQVTTLPHLERVGPTYVASVIAAFRTLVRAGLPDDAGLDSEDARNRFAAVAVLPLTEMLAGPGPFDTLPVADWMIAGGVSQRW